MDSLFFSNDDDVLPFDRSFSPISCSDPGKSIFLVPFSWWKEAARGGGFEGLNGVDGILYESTVRLSIVGMGDSCGEEKVTGDSEIFVRMSREEEARVSGEEGVSGADLAFVSESMFFTALKWHCDKEDVEGLLRRDDLFSLKIRLIYMRKSRHLVIKIRQKDNEVGIFNKAYSIFGTKSGSLHIWDFSGKTHQLFVGDIGQQDEEVRIELQIYGLPYTINEEDRHKQTTGVEQSWIGDPSSSSPLRMNGNVDELNLCLGVMPAAGSVTHSTSALGLTGLYNIGSTCFMNSAIQCLVHTPKLVDYFLGNFRRDLNFENPPGMNGQYRSTLVCPVCEKLSTTFDLFMCLSLPLPSNLREMTFIVLSTDGTTLPRQVTIRVPEKGTFKDLVEALGIGCSLRDDETLLIAKVFGNSIRQVFDDPNAPIDLVLGSDQLVAYRLPKAMVGSRLVEFIHIRKDESFDSETLAFEMFGIPLVARISDFSNGSKIREKFLNLRNPFLLPQEGDSVTDDSNNLPDFKFYLLDTDCFLKSPEILMDEPLDDVSPQTGQCIKVVVSWPHEMSKRHNTSILSFLPVVGGTKTDTHDSISLCNCMDTFLEEPLGQEDLQKILMYDEILSSCLYRLREDLNRVKVKRCIQAEDEDGCPQEEVAYKYWKNHLSRNKSIVVDLCQGRYRSTPRSSQR